MRLQIDGFLFRNVSTDAGEPKKKPFCIRLINISWIRFLRSTRTPRRWRSPARTLTRSHSLVFYVFADTRR